MRDDWRQSAIDGDCRIIEYLAAEEDFIDSRDKYGQTALMLAATHGREEAVRMLVKYGADLDVTAKFNLSALMLAVINRHAGIARHLVDAGADTGIRGGGAPGFHDRTARDLAKNDGQDELATYIAEAEDPVD